MLKKILAASILYAAVLLSGCAGLELTQRGNSVVLGTNAPCKGPECLLTSASGPFGIGQREVVFDLATAPVSAKECKYLWGKISLEGGRTAEVCTSGTKDVDGFLWDAEYLRVCEKGICTLRAPTADRAIINKWHAARHTAEALLLFLLWPVSNSPNHGVAGSGGGGPGGGGGF